MRRLLLVLCAMAAIVAIAVGSGGFSSIGVDRGVTVDVVGDDDAYMALEYSDETVERSATVGENATLPIVNVTNQFTADVDVTVNYTVSGPAAVGTSDGSESAELSPGDELPVSTEVQCEDTGEHRLTVDFDASATGNGVSAETDDSRTVTYDVDCGADSGTR